jgi:3-mercaptopyruvate sulfurtransferase SseA
MLAPETVSVEAGTPAAASGGASDRSSERRSDDDASPPTLRGAALEALRIALVAGCIAATLAILRGTPDVGALRAAEPASCGAPVLARPDVEWIEQEDARALIFDPAVAFVDARPAEAFTAGHIAGATNVPMETGAIDARTTELFRGARTVITYCDTSGDCAGSKRLAGLLAEGGLPDVRVLRGGLPEWLEHGYPAEAGQ